ncbi:MAG TPA: hypothetical protein VNU74_04425, partial [Terriglobales bacterium]|nr:hypothetical protein [Terriglobales bacterium]
AGRRRGHRLTPCSGPHGDQNKSTNPTTVLLLTKIECAKNSGHYLADSAFQGAALDAALAGCGAGLKSRKWHTGPEDRITECSANSPILQFTNIPRPRVANRGAHRSQAMGTSFHAPA